MSVIPGTRRFPEGTYITTMHSINRAINNPAFVVPFICIPVLLVGASVVQFRAGDSRRGWLLAGATATYVLGVLGVTVGGNVPLNNALDAFDLAEADQRDAGTRRRTYERPWNRWHYLRTVGNMGSFALVSAAAIVAAAEE